MGAVGIRNSFEQEPIKWTFITKKCSAAKANLIRIIKLVFF